MEKGAYADAVTVFTRVIEAMSPGDASYIRIKYELAGAYKKDGNEKRALELYSEIKEQDPDFKDINSKIDNMQSTKPAKPETNNKPKKKNRISYI
jgi:tetratricopeptide (TPR) repeat protein